MATDGYGDIDQAAREQDGLTVASAEGKQTEGTVAAQQGGGVTRRSFVAGIGGVAVLCAIGGIRLTGEEYLVRPPGGQDFDLLIGRCIRCGRCMEACPEQVVVMAGIEEGILSQRTPKLDFSSRYCTWCEGYGDGTPLCVASCATGALTLAADAAPETTILGKAEIDTESCVAYWDIGCKFCYDACPYEAIELSENERPSVIDDLCCGCGACEAVCVSLISASVSSTTGDRAIKVRALDAEGNLVGSFQNGGETA